VRLSAPLALLTAGLLGGCKSIPVLAGIAAGAAAGGASQPHRNVHTALPVVEAFSYPYALI